MVVPWFHHDIGETGLLSLRRARCMVGCWRTHIVLGVWCGSSEQQEASGLSVCILTGQVERCVSCLHQHNTVTAQWVQLYNRLSF